MTLKFNATLDEMDIISRITTRAINLADRHGVEITHMEMLMDINACHSNGCPLKLADMLAADDSNFAHDVFGIRRHIDRRTGKLGDCFMPRFADLGRSATSLINLSSCCP